MKEKYAVPAFMYIEYPHKSFWSESFGEQNFKNSLISLFNYKKDPSILLYVHIPYCQKQCYFCTCHTIIDSDYEKVKSYLEILYREIELYRDFFEKNAIHPNIREIHLGGGSPTYVKEKDFDQLLKKMQCIVDFTTLDEFSLEIDPRRVKKERMKFYHDRGINRISFGIQDFDLEVQKNINRVQPAKLTRDLLTPEIKELFKNGVNFDIICGLPGQTKQTIQKMIDEVIKMSPDRICLNYFDYAPKYAKHQLLMPQDQLLNISQKRELFLEALNKLVASGYVRTGYDHFSKPSDEIAKSMKKGSMAWNALGYTPGRCVDILGIGIHSYSRLGPHYYSQNVYELSQYETAVKALKFPIFRGHKLDGDDLIRRDVIQTLRSYFEIDFRKIDKQYQIQFEEYFAEEIERLGEFQSDGLIKITDNSMIITEIGHEYTNLVIRNFDKYVFKASFMG
ncbi:MAG: oxygen-independent coproporphyrinogen III oxidase [Deltaproteobacteria bacterium]|mgnify:CR=1 FL=1